MKRKRADSESSSATELPDATGESSSEEYDVFLSFRGIDTRYDFVDCLHEFLTGAGIRVFMDDEALRVGEDIGDGLLAAIDNSRLYVPVFSRNYASSKWCLIELAHMVESARKSDAKEILPVFFKVEAEDVKLKTDMYTGDLTSHEERYGEDTVGKWREALREIPKSKGWNLRSNQGHISSLLKPKQRILPDHTIGVEKQVQDVVKALNPGSNDVRIVVIHGMGGIGKTTLASAVFNEICQRFQGCSFLSNVRESATGSGMLGLQNKLLQDTLKFSSHDLFDANAAVKRIQSSLQNRDVLVVLDDVSEIDQIRNLIGMGDWLGPGSKVIVTTRNLNCIASDWEIGDNIKVLEGKIIYIYQMRDLDFDNSLQLFCWNAFGVDMPPCRYQQLSHDILSFTGGVPLALVVVGSRLRGKGVAIWKEMLKKFKKAPDDHLYKEILMSSYEMLCDETKEIFLDVAFFLADHDRTIASYYWDACCLFPETSIDALVSYALVKTSGSNRLGMHDLLRDLGREVVRKQSTETLGTRSRLCNEDAKHFLQKREVTKYVKGLKLDSFDAYDFTPADLSGLSNLRFMELDAGNFIGEFKGCLSELRWFSWRNCAPDFRGTGFSLGNLVVLVLSASSINETWIGWEQFKTAKNLKCLELDGLDLKSTPDLSSLTRLERLTIRACPRLVRVDPSIGSLELLNSLELVTKENMLADVFHLPSSIGKLKSLSRLVISGFNMKQVPESIGDLEGLEMLEITRCQLLRKLPSSIGGLVSLLELRLCDNGITELPESIGKLGNLIRMDVSYNSLRGLPAAMGDLGRLEELNVSRNHQFEGVLPREFEKLQSLRSLDLTFMPIYQLPSWVFRRVQALRLGDCFLGIFQAF